MLKSRAETIRQRISGLFIDREIYMRANGELRFLKITGRLQKVAAGTAAVLLTAWLVLSGNLLASQIEMLAERSSVAASLANAQQTYREARARQRSAAVRAEALEERQRALEGLASDYFQLPRGGELTETDAPQRSSAAQLPAGERLSIIERRQQAFIHRFEAIASERAAVAEKAVADLGLNLDRLTDEVAAQGGPYLPVGGAAGDEDLLRLAETVSRLDRLERALLAVPSFMPAEGGRITSGYGLRRDPFTRRAAMHSGQDFSGGHRSGIHAAASGRIVRAGWWGGYGRVVVIDHGAGIRTRYAHLASIDVKRGDRVGRGDRIGGMGSSGRSTGTHLHFEVRIDGKAVNPRPFLETPEDVLEIQDFADRRLTEGKRHAG